MARLVVIGTRLLIHVPSDGQHITLRNHGRRLVRWTRRLAEVAVSLVFLATISGCQTGTVAITAVNDAQSAYVLQIRGAGPDDNFTLHPGEAGMAVITGTRTGIHLSVLLLTEECRLVDNADGRPIQLPPTGSFGLRLTDAGIALDSSVVGTTERVLDPSSTCGGPAPPSVGRQAHQNLRLSNRFWTAIGRSLIDTS